MNKNKKMIILMNINIILIQKERSIQIIIAKYLKIHKELLANNIINFDFYKFKFLVFIKHSKYLFMLLQLLYVLIFLFLNQNLY